MGRRIRRKRIGTTYIAKKWNKEKNMKEIVEKEKRSILHLCMDMSVLTSIPQSNRYRHITDVSLEDGILFDGLRILWRAK